MQLEELSETVPKRTNHNIDLLTNIKDDSIYSWMVNDDYDSYDLFLEKEKEDVFSKYKKLYKEPNLFIEKLPSIKDTETFVVELCPLCKMYARKIINKKCFYCEGKTQIIRKKIIKIFEYFFELETMIPILKNKKEILISRPYIKTIKHEKIEKKIILFSFNAYESDIKGIVVTDNCPIKKNFLHMKNLDISENNTKDVSQKFQKKSFEDFLEI